MADNCEEKVLIPQAGWGMLALLLAGLFLSIAGFIAAVTLKMVVLLSCVVPLGLACFVGLFGCMAVQPNGWNGPNGARPTQQRQNRRVGR